MSNKELIAQLRERIDPYYAMQRGTESHERKLCADALELADKRIAELEAKIDEAYKKGYATGEEESERRIAELEAAIVAWKADQKENMAIAVEECKRANEAERKLAGAREALVVASKWILPDHPATRAVMEALAQIGGEDAGT